jgi:hypothetical protein
LYKRLSIETKGKEEFESLARHFPQCVPARNAVLRETFRYGSRIESIKCLLDRIRSGADFDAYDEICSYLETTGEKSFLAEAASEFSKAFPFSAVPLEYQAKSLSDRDPAGALVFCRKFLAVETSESVSTLASQFMTRLGDNSGYLLMDEYIDEPSAPAAFSSAMMLINAAKYAEARTLLLKIAAEKDDPKVYEAIGRLKILSGSSPDMFWGKTVSLEPSSRFPTDYLMNKAEGKSLPLLNNLRDSATPEAIEKSFIDGKTIEGTVLYRSSIYKVFSNRSGRYFFEEIIYLHNAADIERYGEYRIPFDKNLSIIQCTLLSRDGTRSETYAHHTVDGEQYLTVTGLSPELLLHVSYEVDNYSPVLPYSALICSGSIFINDYDEEVNIFRSVIEVPTAIQLSFASSDSLIVQKKEYDKSIVWTVRAENVSSVRKESHVPVPEKNLKWFSFTESGSYEDLFEWYRGQWPVKAISLRSAFNGISKDETIKKVYEYLSRSIALEERELFSPEYPDDVLFKGKGSSEDKVFCARAMLYQQGIKSYPSLAVRKGTSSGFHPDIFGSVILYIPDEHGAGTWLDFSKPYCPAGTLSSVNENAHVFILSDDGSTAEKIAHSAMKSEAKFISGMIIEPDGSSLCNIKAVYSGRDAVLEKYSGDERYCDELAGFIASDFHTRLILSDIQFPEKNQYGEIAVSMNGKIPGFALLGSRGLSFKPFFHQTSIPEYLSGVSRMSPLYVSEDINTDEQCVITLPEGLESAVIAFSKTVLFSHGSASYSVSKEDGSRSVIVKRTIFFPECEIEPGNYGDFIRFCTELRSIEQMRIVIPWK